MELKYKDNIYFFLCRVSFVDLMALINFINDQNTLRRVIWGYIYTLKI